MAGPEGFEPSLAVLETVVLTIDTMGLYEARDIVPKSYAYCPSSF